MNIGGQILVISGPGPTEVDEPDGIQEDFFPPAGSTLSGTLNGQRWDFVFHGSATARYQDVNGAVVISDPTENGGIDILVNGKFDTSSQLDIATGAYQYTCNGTTMREIYAGANGGSEVLTREGPG